MNQKQYIRIKKLIDALKEISGKVADSISVNSAAVDKFTENAYIQASSSEEINRQKELKDEMNTKTDFVRLKAKTVNELMSDQKTSIDEITKSIETTNQLIQDNVTSTENLKKTTDGLRELTDELQREFNET